MSAIESKSVNAFSSLLCERIFSTSSEVIVVPFSKQKKNLEHSDLRLSVLFSTISRICSTASGEIENPFFLKKFSTH